MLQLFCMIFLEKYSVREFDVAMIEGPRFTS
jgi:hypothetical protein